MCPVCVFTHSRLCCCSTRVIGNTLGNMFGCLASFEDSLASKQRVVFQYPYLLTNAFQTWKRFLRRHYHCKFCSF